MIRVLVVDDSAFMRKAISMMLAKDPGIQVVDTARNGQEALDKVARLQPDVVTLDVEMPVMDGLTALRRIMQEHPRPVLMISSLTKEGADTTIEALQAGAVDFIPKQLSYVSLEINKIEQELLAKVRSIAGARSRLFRRAARAGASPAPSRPASTLRCRDARMIVLGVSTGGPLALQRVIPALPASLPVPVAIVQHMPPHFTRSLAERLNAASVLRVVEAEPGMRLEPGVVALAPGGRHLTFRSSGSAFVAATPEAPSDVLHRPSVDVTFASANEVCGGRLLALVMTGMGKDGLEGARQIKQRGGTVITQDEESCVVYGMPRAVMEAGLSDAAYPLEALAPTLAQAFGQHALAA